MEGELRKMKNPTKTSSDAAAAAAPTVGDQEENLVQLESWDIAYYTEMLRREKFGVDQERVKEFFPLDQTIDRILELYSKLLGLEFEEVTKKLNLWHEEVRAFRVSSRGGGGKGIS